jgi:hypothetical protein
MYKDRLNIFSKYYGDPLSQRKQQENEDQKRINPKFRSADGIEVGKASGKKNILKLHMMSSLTSLKSSKIISELLNNSSSIQLKSVPGYKKMCSNNSEFLKLLDGDRQRKKLKRRKSPIFGEFGDLHFSSNSKRMKSQELRDSITQEKGIRLEEENSAIDWEEQTTPRQEAPQNLNEDRNSNQRSNPFDVIGLPVFLNAQRKLEEKVKKIIEIKQQSQPKKVKRIKERLPIIRSQRNLVKKQKSDSNAKTERLRDQNQIKQNRLKDFFGMENIILPKKADRKKIKDKDGSFPKLKPKKSFGFQNTKKARMNCWRKFLHENIHKNQLKDQVVSLNDKKFKKSKDRKKVEKSLHELDFMNEKKAEDQELTKNREYKKIKRLEYERQKQPDFIQKIKMLEHDKKQKNENKNTVVMSYREKYEKSGCRKDIRKKVNLRASSLVRIGKKNSKGGEIFELDGWNSQKELIGEGLFDDPLLC